MHAFERECLSEEESQEMDELSACIVQLSRATGLLHAPHSFISSSDLRIAAILVSFATLNNLQCNWFEMRTGLSASYLELLCGIGNPRQVCPRPILTLFGKGLIS